MSDDSAAPTGGEIGTVVGGAATGASTAVSVAALAGSTAGPIGLVIGAVIGAAIGIGIVIAQRNTKKDPKEDYTAPEVDRRRSPNADQGTPAPWVQGQWVRVPGQLITMGKMKSDRDDDGVQFDRVTLRVAWCRTVCSDVKRIYANGEILWDDSTLSDNQFDCDEVEYEYKSGVGPKGIGAASLTLTYFFSSDQWDTTDIWNNQEWYEITGISNFVSGNTGAMKLMEQGIRGSRRYLKFFKCSIKITQSGNDDSECDNKDTPQSQASGGSYVYDFGGKGVANRTHLYKDPTHYLGDHPPPSSPIEIGYLGTCSTVLDINLAKWGGTVPRMEALVQISSEPPPLARVIEKIIRLGGANIGASVDVTEIPNDVVVRGLVILGATTPNAMIQELMAFYKVEAFETFKFRSIDSNGNPDTEQIAATLKFVMREEGQVFRVSALETGAHEEGQSGIDRQEITVPDDRDEPNHFVLDYISDAARDFQPGSFEYINSAWEATTDRKRLAKMRTDLVMSDKEAEQHCKTLLYTMQNYRSQMTVSLPPHWLKLRPNDRLIWPTNNVTEDTEMRVIRVTRGQNGLLQIDGMIDSSLAFEQIPDNDIPPAAPPINGGPWSFPWVFDIPPLTAEHAVQFGLYHATEMILYSASEPTSPAEGSQAEPYEVTVYKSLRDLEQWTKHYHQWAPQVAGAVLVPPGPGVCFAWDTASTIRVRLNNPTEVLESATPDEVGAMKKNICIIGREIIGFADVVDLGDNEFELSYLIRGMRNTEFYMDEHETGDPNQVGLFMMITPTNDANNFRFRQLPQGEFNMDLDFVAIPITEALDSNPVRSANLANPGAETLKPFSVRSRWVRRYPDQCYRIHFKMRTRVPFRLLNGSGAPQVEPHCCFKIDVFWFGPGSENGREYIRTLCCCFDVDAEFYMDYTQCMQVEDFHDTGRITDGTYPRFIEFEIYRVSASIGEGRRNVFCCQFEGPWVQFDVDCLPF